MPLYGNTAVGLLGDHRRQDDCNHSLRTRHDPGRILANQPILPRITLDDTGDRQGLSRCPGKTPPIDEIDTVLLPAIRDAVARDLRVQFQSLSQKESLVRRPGDDRG